jgi:hypothetical protein
MSDRDLYERTLDAYRRLIERAAEAVAKAVSSEHEQEGSDPPLDPEPCP